MDAMTRSIASMSTWFVICTLCWQFFFIVGLRWLVQAPSRNGAHR